MKGLAPLILGILGTFALSWLGLTVIPNAQIGQLDPQTDEEGTDVYPMPKSGLAERGREIYAANGCVYCHSQQVRADYAGADIERKWGDRRSAPRDYLFERPIMLGKSRLGPDLSNVGQRAPTVDADAAAPTAASAPAAPVASAAAAPLAAGATAVNPKAPVAPAASPGAPAVAASAPAAPAQAQAQAQAQAPTVANAATAPANAVAPAAVAAGPVAAAAAAPDQTPPAKSNAVLPYSAAWHHQLLYAPRSIAKYSNMPPYRFLYEKRRIGGAPSADALILEGDEAPPEGWEIVPTYEAKCLVAYLMSLNQSHALNEVRTATAAAAPAAAAAAPGGAAK